MSVTHFTPLADISCLYTEIFRSEDEGKTWNYVGKVEGMWWATIFENNGELYLIGRYTSGGISGSGPHYIGVTKSTDGGVTWSDIDATKGGISYDGGRGVHCAPTPVLKLNGKIYRVFESTSVGIVNLSLVPMRTAIFLIRTVGQFLNTLVATAFRVKVMLLWGLTATFGFWHATRQIMLFLCDCLRMVGLSVTMVTVPLP